MSGSHESFDKSIRKLGTPTSLEPHTDERGTLFVLNDGDPISFIETITFERAGDVRGNHFHKDYDERVFVQCGSIEVLARHIDSGEEIVCTVKVGELLVIPKMTLHSFEALEPSLAVCFGSGSSPSVDRHYLPDIA